MICFGNVIFVSPMYLRSSERMLLIGLMQPYAHIYSMNYLELLDRIKAHVENLFATNKDDRLIYHNAYHTEQVVKNAVRIANHYKLSDVDFFTVVTAAWFHDIGYLSSFEKHEEHGAEAATVFLRLQNVDEATIKQISECILATKMPQKPIGLLQDIICDADLFHLGSDSFKDRNKLMRKEAEAFCGKKIEKDQWRQNTIALFHAHHYHTDYGQQQLNKGKEENLKDLESKNTDKHHGTDPEKVTVITKEPVQSNKTEKKKNSDRPEKGIETMFRITSGNHQRLSDMADNKAHIMISTNSIILSVILSILLRKLEDNPHLIVPTLLLLIICVVTMVFSILATRPHVPPGRFTEEDVTEKRVNLLFFGNFYRMSLPEYEGGMLKMMEDREFLYGSLIKDLYFQGVVLGRKYRFLRVAYNVFMFGIIAAVLAFIIAIALVAI
jgi:predicted metal-dependent HD superfamily phosphohydrolase